MTRRKQYAGWPIWLFMVLLAIVVISALLTLPAMILPYMASSNYKWFCHFVLTPICFVLFVFSVLYTVHRAHRDPYAKIKTMPGGWGGWLKTMVFCVIISFAFGWIFILIATAIPSKFFAQTKVDIPVVTDHLEGFRLDTDYWTWIYFDKDGRTGRVMWARSSPLLSTLKKGDCIMLHAREWPLGTYVDSISRSTACKGKN